MDLITRRRSLMCVNSAPPDNKIWLIKNGIEQAANTGGFYPRAGYIWSNGMSGWVAIAPTINQEQGYINFKIKSNGAAVGCIMPGSFITYRTVKYKSIYIDAEWSLSGSGAYWVCLIRGSNNENYAATNSNRRKGASERKTFSVYIGEYGENPSGINALIQMSTRSESNINIYNMWIE